MMRIQAVPIKGKDLKPGDIFSVVGPEYWDNIDQYQGIGQKAYIRTNAPSQNAMDREATVFQLIIKR